MSNAFRRRLAFMWLLLTTMLMSSQPAHGQVVVSPTPVRIVIPTAGPTTAPANATPTLTRTPTPLGPVVLEAKTEANVRSQPDPNSELLGTIRAGDVYPIIGRYFRWLQFQFPTSPSGTGWVFEELVTVIGDATAIRDLTVEAAPTADETALAQTATFEFLTQIPGGVLTATASARIIIIPTQPGVLEATTPDPSQENPVNVLPTFTWPPDQALALAGTLPVAGSTASLDESQSLDISLSVPDRIPPIVLILALGGAGVLGLVISTLRR